VHLYLLIISAMHIPTQPSAPGPSGSPGEVSLVHFSVDPSVIFQLGENLISDAPQALMELIKNACDADASSVIVEVDTTTRERQIVVEVTGSVGS
jgi:hypothetical protein